jgi:hypothetical protein
MAARHMIRIYTLTSVISGFAAVCIMLCSQAAQAQTSPVISNIYPNGTNLFQPSSTLSFTAAASAGVTNVTVELTGSTLSGLTTIIKNLTLASGLTVAGPNTGETVSAALTSNTVYAVVIQVTDANGHTATANIAYFDTIAPSYTWEAEDFDYGGGRFIDNPQVNAYAGLVGASGTDYNNTLPGQGQSAYRPQGLETENPNSTGDTPRLQYVNTTNIDYDVGYAATGEWGNYTRHYPAGLYNVYVRASGGNGPFPDAGEITNVSGAAAFAGTGPYTWSVAGRGWSSYTWCPVMDSSNNLAQLATDGTVSTLRAMIDKGNCDENFFMLVPADTNPVPNSTSLANLYPDGTVQFQPAGALTFTANSSNGIDPTNILVRLGMTNLLGVSYATNYTTGNGMVVTGTDTSRNVSVPLSSNMTYSAFIQIIDGGGNPQGFSFTFDTIAPSYTWEAEDFDYGGGKFIDNPQTNAYYGLGSVEGIDILVSPTNQETFAYRGAANPFGAPDALNTEVSGDKPRAAYADTNNIDPVTLLPYVDYDVGYNSGGDWANYTRHFPAGSYNIYVRASSGVAIRDSNLGYPPTNVGLVTQGYGTSTQTVSNLGSFTVYPTGGWQTYAWVPLVDAYGNHVVFTGGGQQTLQIQTLGLPGNDYNVNFYMLVPAIIPPEIINLYPNGAVLFQAANKLSFATTSGSEIATSNIVVTLNGTNVSGLSFSPIASGWQVTCLLQLNESYTMTISVTDNAGHSASSGTIYFDTFQSTDYQWQACDYDYTSISGVPGQFFDNPQTNAYYNLPSTAGIDNLQSDPGANPFEYRNVDPAGTLGPSPSTTPSADLPRAQFLQGGTDYNIGFFGPGSWCNYTRHYPAGTYYVWERYAEGGQTTVSTLSKVTSGYGTVSQTTSLLGTFSNPVDAWSVWSWAPLTDANGNLVPVTLNGLTTLQLGGSPITAQPEVNIHFLMLVPTSNSISLIASFDDGNITISFPTLMGSSYQVLYKIHLTDATWTALGAPISGNNAVQSVSEPVVGGAESSVFYRVQMSK